MTAIVREARTEDAFAIWPHMIDLHRAVMDKEGNGVIKLVGMVEISADTFYAEDDGVPICLGGIIPTGGTLLSQVGAMWMAVTDELGHHHKQLLRESRARMNGFKERYVGLYDYCDVNDLQTLRWLKWLGFRLRDPVPSMYGDGRIMYPVEWRRWE